MTQQQQRGGSVMISNPINCREAGLYHGEIVEEQVCQDLAIAAEQAYPAVARAAGWACHDLAGAEGWACHDSAIEEGWSCHDSAIEEGWSCQCLIQNFTITHVFN